MREEGYVGRGGMWGRGKVSEGGKEGYVEEDGAEKRGEGGV